MGSAVVGRAFPARRPASRPPRPPVGFTLPYGMTDGQVCNLLLAPGVSSRPWVRARGPELAPAHGHGAVWPVPGREWTPGHSLQRDSCGIGQTPGPCASPRAGSQGSITRGRRRCHGRCSPWHCRPMLPLRTWSPFWTPVQWTSAASSFVAWPAVDGAVHSHPMFRRNLAAVVAAFAPPPHKVPACSLPAGSKSSPKRLLSLPAGSESSHNRLSLPAEIKSTSGRPGAGPFASGRE